MNSKILLNLFFLIGYGVFLTAQVQLSSEVEQKLIKELHSVAHNLPYQQIYVQTDKDVYELGEDLWFKSYHIDTHTRVLDSSSRVLYVQLVHSETNKTLLSQKHEIEGGIATGHIFISEKWKEGEYHLLMQTENSLKANDADISGVKSIVIKKNMFPSVLAQVNFDKERYKTQDTVTVNFDIYNSKGIPLEGTLVKVISYDETGSEKYQKKYTDQHGKTQLKIIPKKSQLPSRIEVILEHDKKQAIYYYQIPLFEDENIQLGFYPEGGHLVKGLMSKVAFKAVDKNGLPLDIEGQLYENDKPIAKIKSTHNGMGSFDLKPIMDFRYYVKLTDSFGGKRYNLPNIHKEGIVMKCIETIEDTIHFEIKQTARFLNSEDFFVRAQMRGEVLWMATGRFINEKMDIEVPLKKMKKGIIEITIFDKSFNPLVERLIFANMQKRLNITHINNIRTVYKSRERVDLSFKVTDQNYIAAKTQHLGLRVFNKLYSDSLHNQNILSHQYLETELKGKIHTPDYYFNLNNVDRNDHLDLLLLTQGWRSYQWNQNNLETIKDFKSLTSLKDDISGKVYKILEDGTFKQTLSELSVITPNEVIPYITNNSGTFGLNTTFLKEAQGSTLFIKPRKGYTLKFNDPFKIIETIVSHKQLSFEPVMILAKKEKAHFFSDNFGFDGVNKLEEIIVTGYKQSKKAGSRTTLFKPSYTDYVCLYDILNCLNHSSGRDPVYGQSYKTGNGKSIVYKGLKPKVNDENSLENVQNTIGFLAVKGFYPKKKFYSPKYDEKDDLFVPDFRRTLIWDPNVMSDENGIITVSFYTSDITSTFIVDIEGINDTGLLGHSVFEFKVNPKRD